MSHNGVTLNCNEVFVKRVLRGFACAILALGCSVTRAGAWQQQPAAPPAGSPANPQPPDQEPGAATGDQKLVLPEAPKIPNLIEPDERGVSVGVASWYQISKPWVMKGVADNPYNGDVQMQGRPNPGNGWIDLLVNLPGHNALRFTYWSTVAHGSTVVANDLGLFTLHFLPGDYMVTDYRIKGAKIDFEYLTWPYPVKNSKFRLKTTWGVEYFQMRAGFAGPFVPTTDEAGNLLDTVNGSAFFNTQSTKHLYLPMVGVKAQEYIRPKLRLEFGASGFGIPHHQNSWNAEATVNWRFAEHFEFQGGARAFHFHTSAKQDFFMQGTQAGPFFGVRWYSSGTR